jgi:hypothetical protein
MRVLAAFLGTFLALAPLAAGATGTNAENSAYVSHAYQLVLGRPPDVGAALTFTNGLNAGTMTRDQVVAFLINSNEFRTHEVSVLYQKYLHRMPDPFGSNALVSMLAGGQTSSALAATLIGSQEYFQLAGGTSDGFVRKIFTDVLYRPADQMTVKSWSMQLAQGRSRQDVATLILTSAEGAPKFLAFLFTNVAHGTGEPHGTTLSDAVQFALEPHPTLVIPVKPSHAVSPTPHQL